MTSSEEEQNPQGNTPIISRKYAKSCFLPIFLFLFCFGKGRNIQEGESKLGLSEKGNGVDLRKWADVQPLFYQFFFSRLSLSLTLFKMLEKSDKVKRGYVKFYMIMDVIKFIHFPFSIKKNLSSFFFMKFYIYTIFLFNIKQH